MKNKLILGLAGIVLAGSLNNLYGQDKDYESLTQKTLILNGLIFDSQDSKHSKALEKYIPITKQEIQSDTSRFKTLNSGLKEYINKIYIIDEKDFYSEERLNGHAHPYGGILCLTENYVNRALFHETGHIRYSVLDEINSDFSQRWKEISNFNYGKHNFYYSKDKLKEIRISPEIPVWKNGKVGPNYGCLAPLSTGFISEDVAIFIECLGYEETPESLKIFYDQFKVKEDEILKGNDEKLKLTLNLEFYLGYFPLFFADTTDRRYKQKLDLLKEYNFLTKEEHEKLSKDLGSLNYLLNN